MFTIRGGLLGRRRFLAHAAAGAGALLGGLLAPGCSGPAPANGPPRDAGDNGSGVRLGPGASLGGKRLFPDDNPWNQDVSKEPVDPDSDALIAAVGLDKSLHPDFGTVYDGAPLGIPYVVVPGDQPRVPVRFGVSADESDPGPYPIPPDAPIEGGPKSDDDRHLLVLDRDHWMLYELIRAFPDKDGWKADSGAVFDLNSNKLRPAGWTSANAAGLPILPGLVRYDEVMEQKEVRHALAFTCKHTRRAYVAPARHFASRDPDPKLPPMGMRVRLKRDLDVSSFPAPAQVILKALQRYGMFLAQNGGDWYLNGAPDSRWNDKELSSLKKINGRDFEVVKMGEVVMR
jgi:hypothetical protein